MVQEPTKYIRMLSQNKNKLSRQQINLWIHNFYSQKLHINSNFLWKIFVPNDQYTASCVNIKIFAHSLKVFNITLVHQWINCKMFTNIWTGFCLATVDIAHISHHHGYSRITVEWMNQFKWYLIQWNMWADLRKANNNAFLEIGSYF